MSNNKNELSTSLNYKNNIICFNNTIQSRKNSNKNSNKNSITNTLNFNIYPLSRDNSKTYIKKKSSNIINNNNNGSNNLISNTNRGNTIKHKKNYSISSSCYNTQRTIKDPKFTTKNKSSNNNKNNYLYSPKKNKIGKSINTNKSIIVPEYKVKLDNIKSRVTELLNVYSLLALRSINNSNEQHINVQVEENDMNDN